MRTTPPRRVAVAAGLVAVVVASLLAAAPTPAARAVAAPERTVDWVAVAPDRLGGLGGARLHTELDGGEVWAEEIPGELGGIRVYGGGSWPVATFAPPYGEDLEVGRTYDDPRYDNSLVPYPGMDIGDTRCGSLYEDRIDTGSFTVLDLTPDLSRVWIRYEFQCGRGSATGEVRIGQPTTAPYDVAPTQVRWAGRRVGEQGRFIPVTVMNPATTPLRVTTTAVTRGRATYRVRHTDCATVAPGGWCHVWVGFRPQREGVVPGALTVGTDAGPTVVPLSGRGVAAASAPSAVSLGAEPGRAGAARSAARAAEPVGAGRVRWRMRSDADSWVGQGRTYSLGPVVERAHGDDGYFTLDADDWSIRLATDDGQLLLPGTVVSRLDVGRVSDWRAGDLDVSGDHRGCGNLEGNGFTVHRAGYRRDGSLRSLVVTFTQRCGDDTGDLRGVLAWNDAGPLPAVPASTSARPRPPVDFLFHTRRPPPGGTTAGVGGLLTSEAAGPVTGTVRVQRMTGQGWRDAGTHRVVAGGFETTMRFRRPTFIRARLLPNAVFQGTGWQLNELKTRGRGKAPAA